jgi:hypothetical protein
VLSGQALSKIEFYDLEQIFCDYEPIYVDNLGIPDIFFSRGKNITLSSEKLEKLIDFILSSKCVCKEGFHSFLDLLSLF